MSQWPQTSAEDVKAFLIGIRGSGQAESESANFHTPYSVQVLQSGATLLTKWWAPLVGVFGGTPAFIALIEGFFGNTGSRPADVFMKIALVASGAVLLSTCAIAIAIIVRGDVNARATAHAARSRAEGEIVATVLANYKYAAWPTGYVVRKKDGTYLPVAKFNYTKDSGWVITTRTNDSLNVDQVDAVIPAMENEFR